MSDYYKIAQELMENNISDYILSDSNLDVVIKFHQSSSRIPASAVKNLEHSVEKSRWAKSVKNKNITNVFNENKIPLNFKSPEWPRNIYNFDMNYKLSRKEIAEVLVNSFGKVNNKELKRYNSLGDLYPVIPLLLIFDRTAIEGFSPGCYLFDSTNFILLKLKPWNKKEKIEFSTILMNETKLPSYTAIAYAIDIRRAITLDGVRGYRHAMIEIGSMSQSLREVLWKMSGDIKFGELCWSDFPDNSTTFLCGLNVRMAPIVLLQWFGKDIKGVD